MLVETFPVGPLGCNCSLVADPTTKDALVIDPGGDFEKIRGRIDALGLKVRAILHTHTHIDHVGATAELQRATSAPARIHEGDRFLYEILPVQAGLLRMRAPAVAELDTPLRDDETLTIGGLVVRVVHTPGHTPGSCCFDLRLGGDEGVLFAGDTLFEGSVGRTDLWGGDSDKLVASVRGKLFSLPDPTRVVCGHGDDTTIGDEKRHNPFVGLGARGR